MLYLIQPFSVCCMVRGFKIFYIMQTDEYFEKSRENVDSVDSNPNEIYRFELLRNELIELEKRVQGSTNESVNEEVSNQTLLLDFLFVSIF